MSERKVLTKYFPPDFDPRALTRKRGPKSTGVKTQAVRIMAPFSMKCTTCGEYIYKGRKFNSRKETPQGERYLGIQIFFFSIRCTRCSAEIIFRTDPKINDYTMVKGAVRNMEPWRNRAGEDEGVEERLDRLEREEAEAAGEEEKNAMEDLEAKNADARREMAAADALDEIRQRNARIQRSEKEGVDFADYVRRSWRMSRRTTKSPTLCRGQLGGASSSSSSSGGAPSASSSSSSSSTTPMAGAWALL
ncbi:cell cycle control protein cwf16 [Verticillium dahliae VdLs.17]|uniref:Splicing factor YJU2 n=1 Tax=Verticillium dahliae (strain VdLs.17 / ATCC MYA-4575 / FGSC 10137) TaxID=498257 RepID=G2XE36_VERDV|nr:cell cycle control protein cwf16 [Verticillium dahliae VdLs.17]EGY18084.1 cell cycle control protein cwf16 [Verticillium dahliae VdLs.17]